MTLGQASNQLDLLDPVTGFCDDVLPDNSIFGFLHRERDNLFPDTMFADLFAVNGRRSVPPSVVATVMVLQRLEGLSDREAVERFCFDARWRYAAGVGGWDGAGPVRFVHTVLVDMRQRLRDSPAPDRVFEVGLAAARAAGLIGRKRVLDSTHWPRSPAPQAAGRAAPLRYRIGGQAEPRDQPAVRSLGRVR